MITAAITGLVGALLLRLGITPSPALLVGVAIGVKIALVGGALVLLAWRGRRAKK